MQDSLFFLFFPLCYQGKKRRYFRDSAKSCSSLGYTTFPLPPFLGAKKKIRHQFESSEQEQRRQ